MTVARIVRAPITPLQILSALEQARAALDAGNVREARQYVDSAHSRLAQSKADQDVVLDASAQTREPERAPRVTKTRYAADDEP